MFKSSKRAVSRYFFAMRSVLCLCLGLAIVGCTTLPDRVDAPANGTAQRDAWVQWQGYAFPGKRATEFVAQRLDGRDAMAVTSDNAVSMLRHTVRIEPAQLGRVQFSWKVPALIDAADMSVREVDDSPVRMVLAFDGDRSSFSGRNYRMNEMMKLLTGEEMPYATLMYVWCNVCELGSVIHGPRTDRIRKIAVEQGKQHLNQWRDYERDIRADYLKAYGEAPGALIGVALMTDTDNTQSQVKAWYGKVTLSGR